MVKTVEKPNQHLNSDELSRYNESNAKWKWESEVVGYLNDHINVIACREEFLHVPKQMYIPRTWFDFELGKCSSRYERCCLTIHTCKSLPRLANLIKLINDVFYISKKGQ